MIVGALQMNVHKNDKVANLRTVSTLINRQADLVVLPELFSTGYFFDSKEELTEIAEEIPNGYTTEKLCEIAKEANCHLVGTIVEKENDRLYITAVVAGPSGYIGKHRKSYLTKNELNYYSRGEDSQVFDVNGCKIGIVICFEGWFPESTRELMFKGAQIICHSVLTTQERTLDIMRVRAIENKAFLIVANSISTETYQNDPITFRGESRVIDYSGKILIDAGKEETLILVNVDQSETVVKDLEDCNDIISEVRKHRP